MTNTEPKPRVTVRQLIELFSDYDLDAEVSPAISADGTSVDLYVDGPDYTIDPDFVVALFESPDD